MTVTTAISGGMCPVCGRAEVYSYVDPYMIRCDNCLIKWHTQLRYDMALDAFMKAKGEEKPDYIASGDMQRDVEAVVEIAILESEFDTIKRIGKEVANRTQASVDRGDPAQKTVDIILLYITEEVKNALWRQGKDIT